MLRRHAPPSPPAARARELRAPHAPAPCTRAPRRTPGPAGPPRGIATGITGISGAIIGFGLPQLKRASRPGGGLSGKRMRPARPSGRTAFLALQRGFQPRSPLRSKELLRHAPPSTSGMKNAPGKRPQTDTKSPTIPAAPAIDRSPAAKGQALPNDGSDLLTPHSITSLSELFDEPGPFNLLTGNAATASETDRVPDTMSRNISSIHETMTAQTVPKHDQKPIVQSAPLDWCPGVHMARSTPPLHSFPRRNALLHSPTDPTSRPLSALPPRHPPRLVIRSVQ